MTLRQCSKADLIWVIERMCMRSMGRNDLDIALSDLAYEKAKARIEKAEEYAKLADEKRRAYISLLEPYDGKKLLDIPMDVLEKADELRKEAWKADREWAKLIGCDLSKSKDPGPG